MATTALNETNPILLYSEINGDDGAGANAHIMDNAICPMRFDSILAVSNDTADQTLTFAWVDPQNNQRDATTVTVPHGSGLTANQFDIVPHVKPPNMDGIILPAGWGARLITEAGITAGKRIFFLSAGGTL